MLICKYYQTSKAKHALWYLVMPQWISNRCIITNEIKMGLFAGKLPVYDFLQEAIISQVCTHRSSVLRQRSERRRSAFKWEGSHSTVTNVRDLHDLLSPAIKTLFGGNTPSTSKRNTAQKSARIPSLKPSTVTHLNSWHSLIAVQVINPFSLSLPACSVMPPFTQRGAS